MEEKMSKANAHKGSKALEELNKLRHSIGRKPLTKMPVTPLKNPPIHLTIEKINLTQQVTDFRSKYEKSLI